MSTTEPAQPRADSSIDSLVAAGVETGIEKFFARLTANAGLLPVPKPWLRAKAAGAYLGLSIITMAKWRTDGVGPKYNRIGTRPYYHVEALDDFLRGNAANLPPLGGK